MNGADAVREFSFSKTVTDLDVALFATVLGDVGRLDVVAEEEESAPAPDANRLSLFLVHAFVSVPLSRLLPEQVLFGGGASWTFDAVPSFAESGAGGVAGADSRPRVGDTITVAAWLAGGESSAGGGTAARFTIIVNHDRLLSSGSLRLAARGTA